MKIMIPYSGIIYCHGLMDQNIKMQCIWDMSGWMGGEWDC